MKVTADMLTEECGFINGAIVEWDTYLGKFHAPFDKDNINSDCYFGIGGDWDNDTYSWGDELISIKVLTGPMSIWNHAPEWAEYCIVDKDFIQFLSDIETSDFAIGLFSIIERPWWAKE